MEGTKVRACGGQTT